MKTKAFFIFSLLFMSWGAQAHQTNLSSTVLVEQENQKWVLQVSASLTAFEYQIEEYYGKSSYSTPKEFQKLVVDYVRAHVAITLNDNQLAVLTQGMIKLGHETSVTFQLSEMPKDIQLLSVYNGSFSNISRNKGVVYILKEGFNREQFILNNDNNHTVKLRTADSKFELVKQEESKSYSNTWVMAFGVLVVSGFGFLIYK
ncbi:conserved hypothetical protein [Formosa agariphila KMM 3901]|uniref:Uncharacterized protein n=1 Tax=Formosa agariphila (strain DSM 15362 / KCTC 12365 / LMG 23005 / KMM 3901 / M-2Alg 35-1) TaxID=1347342 RepID=T2KKB4_FORAG|nr:DUF6702 family protein [Formosa agariphila]CDF78883.1 conserved hypothetical protein [Formosa agariphila KMM 3901]